MTGQYSNVPQWTVHPIRLNSRGRIARNPDSGRNERRRLIALAKPVAPGVDPEGSPRRLRMAFLRLGIDTPEIACKPSVVIRAVL